MLLVTHDFEDAAALADTVGVIVDGHLRQLGTPHELVAEPSDSFVASFTGANLLEGYAEPSANGSTRVTLDDGTVDHDRRRTRPAASRSPSTRGT